MDKPRSPEKGVENRERRTEDEAGFSFDSASRASVMHPDRNEDALLGDPDAAARDVDAPPLLDTFETAQDAAALADALARIAAHSEELAKNRVTAVLDGVSGRKIDQVTGESLYNGMGALASRLAGAAASEALAGMPALISTELAKARAAAALGAAHDAVIAYRDAASVGASPERKAEVFQLSTTMDLVLFAEGEDGGTDAVIAHCGDSRIYRRNAADGTLDLLTVDENMVGKALAEGKISKEDYAHYADALSFYDLPERLRTNGVFKDEKEFQTACSQLTAAVGANAIQPEQRVRVVRVKKGDELVLCSDGLTDNMNGEALGALLKDGANAERIAAAAENAFHKVDDVTLRIVKVGDLSEARSKREATKKQLRDKMVWAKSAAKTIESADPVRADALRLAARKDEATLLELTTQDALATFDMTAKQFRKHAERERENLEIVDRALANSDTPVHGMAVNKRKARRDQAAADQEALAAIVADLDRLDAMRAEIARDSARPGPDEDAIRAAREKIENPDDER